MPKIEYVTCEDPTPEPEGPTVTIAVGPSTEEVFTLSSDALDPIYLTDGTRTVAVMPSRL